MALLQQQPKGIKAVADSMGVRRHWWQSDRTVARNVVRAVQGRNPLRLLSGAFAASVRPRRLVGETYTEAEGFHGFPVDGQKPDYICREWVFRYSDGDVETVTTRRAVT